MLDFIRDCFTVAVFAGIMIALLVHTIRVEVAFLFKDNQRVVETKRPARPSPEMVLEARRRLALAKE